MLESLAVLTGLILSESVPSGHFKHNLSLLSVQ